ncbi:MAG: hypothetical protein ABI220_02960 [Candidatus Saccharimonadales bacterium]
MENRIISIEERWDNINAIQARLDAGETIMPHEVSPLTHSPETVVLAALSRRSHLNRL